jgi:hypothetical protein
MERSEGVSVVLLHIMKMMDRSGDRLLRGFKRFERLEIRVATSSKASEPTLPSASHLQATPLRRRLMIDRV